MDDEFLKEIWEQFSIEVDEHCSTNEEILIGATSSQLTDDQINSAFRAFHTIKGLSRSLSLTVLEKIAHSAEDVLGDVREKRLVLDDDAISTLLKANDQMRIIADNSTQEMKEIADNPVNLINNLKKIRLGELNIKSNEKLKQESIIQSEDQLLNQEIKSVKPGEVLELDNLNFKFGYSSDNRATVLLLVS